jgi:acyl-CoA synthetase (AMP-forming)/AMP-acid ligase II
MNWIDLPQLLTSPDPQRGVSLAPELNHQQLCHDALRIAGGLHARGLTCIAVHLEDAAELATVLLGAWRAGIKVLLPNDLQPASRLRLNSLVQLWITDLATDATPQSLFDSPLAAAELDVLQPLLTLCTSGSSGEAKLIDKQLIQLNNEVRALEHSWGADLTDACVLGSVAPQHIYGLLHRVLWPLCAGRPFIRQALPFPEDLQRESLGLARPCVWIASPALLKRLGDNLDWDALHAVRRVFSSGGPLPDEAATHVHERLNLWPTEIYGSSETGGIAWRQGPQAWTPLPDVTLSLNELGALRVESGFLPAGKFEQTADAAELHPDGRFSLRGRLDRIVKLEEKRVSLPMLEHALLEHPWVDDGRLGVVQEQRAFLGALVTLTPAGLHALRNQGRRAVTQALRKHLQNHCEALAMPRRWRLLDQLPFNTQGKLPQALVEALLAAPRPQLAQLLDAQLVDGEWHLQLGIPLDLAHFSGHFPTAPVLPGVLQIDWALLWARERISLPPHFGGMEVLKFQHLIRPGDRIQLSLRFDEARGKLHFAYRNGEQPCASGRILLKDAHV